MSYDLAGDPGAVAHRKQGTVQEWEIGEWVNIGTLGTEGSDAEDPKDDVPESWAFLKADEILLA